MKSLAALRQPTTLGVGLFIAAASVLIAVIVTANVGLVELTRIFSSIAQPLSAAAVAVLIYLAMSEQEAGSTS